MLYARVWDEKSPINGVPAEQVLANRQDLVAAHGDIFLVVDEYDKVSEIQIGKVIASNYNMGVELGLQEIAEMYLVKKEEEKAAAEQEVMINEELQAELAALSYDVMMLQMNMGVNEE